MHPRFERAEYTTRFIDETPELFRFPRKRDRATRAAALHRRSDRQRQPGGERRAAPSRIGEPRAPRLPAGEPPRRARSSSSTSSGRERFAQWMLEQRARAAHGHHAARCAPVAARHAIPHTRYTAAIAPLLRAPGAAACSRWSAGAARPSTSRLRFLQRVSLGTADRIPRSDAEPAAADAAAFRKRASATRTIPDNVVRYFVEQAARSGVDLFRVFDSLNWVENMRVAIDAVRRDRPRSARRRSATPAISTIRGETQVRPRRTTCGSRRSSKRAGAHVLGIKDMAGLCQPARRIHAGQGAQARRSACRCTSTPHDTSGIAAASVLDGDRRRRRCGRRRARFDERA